MDFKKIKEAAQQEINEEFEKKAKDRLKAKLRERALAEQTLKNIDREIEDLEDELQQGKG